jgi:hypothetical protein
VVLLVGGSSRIPLVSQLVQSSLGRPVAIDVHTKHAVALGASVAAELSGFSGRVSDDPHLVEAAEAAYLGKSPPLPYSDEDDRAAAPAAVGARPVGAQADAAGGRGDARSAAATSYPPGPPVGEQFQPGGPVGEQFRPGGTGAAPSSDPSDEGPVDAARKRFWRRKR